MELEFKIVCNSAIMLSAVRVAVDESLRTAFYAAKEAARKSLDAGEPALVLAAMDSAKKVKELKEQIWLWMGEQIESLARQADPLDVRASSQGDEVPL